MFLFVFIPILNSTRGSLIEQTWIFNTLWSFQKSIEPKKLILLGNLNFQIKMFPTSMSFFGSMLFEKVLKYCFLSLRFQQYSLNTIFLLFINDFGIFYIIIVQVIFTHYDKLMFFLFKTQIEKNELKQEWISWYYSVKKLLFTFCFWQKQNQTMHWDSIICIRLHYSGFDFKRCWQRMKVTGMINVIRVSMMLIM